MESIVALLFGIVPAVITGVAAHWNGKRKLALMEAKLQAQTAQEKEENQNTQFKLLIESNSAFRKEQEAYRAELKMEIQSLKNDLERARSTITSLMEENKALKARIKELEDKTAT